MKILVAGIVGSIAAGIASMAFGQAHVDACDDRYTKAKTELDAQYNIGIAAYTQMVDNLRKAKFDPTNYPWQQPDGSFIRANILQLRSDTERHKTEDTKALREEVEHACKDLSALQGLVNKATALATLGVLPEKSTHIDASELLDGKPFGGPHSDINKAREQVLHNDQGEIARIVRDPVQRPRQIANDIAKHLRIHIRL